MVLADASAGRLGDATELLEKLPTPVCYLAGPDHRVQFANQAFVALVGERDLIGRPVREVLPEIQGQGYLELADEVYATGTARTGREADVWLVEGGERAEYLLDYSLEPVTDREGAVAGVLVHVVDVTPHVVDRRRLEALTDELGVAQERYRTLFDTMPDGVVYHGADGAIVAANPSAGAVLGVDPSDLVGLRPQGEQWQAVREDGSPFPGHEHPAMVALQTGQVVAEVVMGVAHGRTGERRWLLVTAVPDSRDEEGTPQRAYAMFRDITEQRRTAAALRERDSFLTRLRDANVLGIVLGDERQVLDANDAFLDMVGYRREDLLAGRVRWRAMTPPEWAHRDDFALQQLRERGACDPFEKEFFHADGHRVPVLLGAAVVEQDPLSWVTFVADLSERQRAEDDRARLLATAQAARAEAQSADDRLGLLLRAGAVVAAMQDPEDLLGHVTRLVVPAIADAAAVFLPTPEGGLLAAAVEHRDPAMAALLRPIRRRAFPPTSETAVLDVHRAGRSRLVPDVQRHLDEWASVDRDIRDLVADLHIGSLIAVPLIHGPDRLGVLALARERARTAFSPPDVVVAEELGRRLAVGLASADTFAREHTVAEMLQRSVLPDRLPDVPGVDVAVVYLPATEAVDVGGDWYDAFDLGGGRLGLVVGDVVGHNLASASVMNQVRNALRAYAVDSDDPATVLARTNTALARLLPGALATVFYGVLDVGRGELTYAGAGHPPPLCIGAEGADYLTVADGVMLGVEPEADYRTSARLIEPGSSLLVYSDGLVEDRSRSLDEGLAALAEVFAERRPAGAAEVCDAAQAALLTGPSRPDDVCLLAVHLPGGS